MVLHSHVQTDAFIPWQMMNSITPKKLFNATRHSNLKKKGKLYVNKIVNCVQKKSSIQHPGLIVEQSKELTSGVMSGMSSSHKYVYWKCTSSCPSNKEDRARLFSGNSETGVVTSSKLLWGLPIPLFNRTSYCCDTNLCNQAPSGCPVSLLMTFVAFAVGIVAFWSMETGMSTREL